MDANRTQLPLTEALSPEDYIGSLDEPRRSEVAEVDSVIRSLAPELKRIMCSGMIGYGPIHYKYASGREGDICRVLLASKKTQMTLHICAADAQGYVAERYKSRFPKTKVGKGCIGFKRAADLDQAALRDLIREAVASTWGS